LYITNEEKLKKNRYTERRKGASENLKNAGDACHVGGDNQGSALGALHEARLPPLAVLKVLKTLEAAGADLVAAAPELHDGPDAFADGLTNTLVEAVVSGEVFEGAVFVGLEVLLLEVFGRLLLLLPVLLLLDKPHFIEVSVLMVATKVSVARTARLANALDLFDLAITTTTLRVAEVPSSSSSSWW
jgi:hypothetical protein